MKIFRFDGICLSCKHSSFFESDCEQSEVDIFRDELTRVVAECDKYKKRRENDAKHNCRCS